jgi:hypothetical protein
MGKKKAPQIGELLYLSLDRLAKNPFPSDAPLAGL